MSTTHDNQQKANGNVAHHLFGSFLNDDGTEDAQKEESGGGDIEHNT